MVMLKTLIMFVISLSVFVAAVPAHADNRQFEAESAVSEILFDYDGAETYATYVVADDGFVEITFASNIPDELYSEILQRLRQHENIPGVLAGTTGPACPTSKF